MAFDPLSPVAPAYVTTLLLPLGPIKKSRFQEFATRLERESVIRLGDISPDSRPDRTTFSPKAFPSGCIFYNFIFIQPPSHHVYFSPFEISRVPLLVVCIVDGKEYAEDAAQDSILEHGLQQVQDSFPAAALIQPVVFDIAKGLSPPKFSKIAIAVPPGSSSKLTTMKTVMCDISARFLAELSFKARSIQESTTLETPISSSLGAMHVSATSTSFRSSGFGNQGPDSLACPSSPADSEVSFRSDGTMDEKPSRNTSQQYSHGDSAEADTPKPLARSDKLLHSERAKIKLKTRQIIVLGSFYLATGRWADAFRELAENTNKTRAFADHRWHAKGLEYILVVMLLLAWNGMEFSIPHACLAQQEKPPTSKTPSQGNIAGVKPASQGDNHQTLDALSAVIPNVIDMIQSAHARASENKPDLFPPVLFSDTIIHLSCLYALLYRNNGKLDRPLLDLIVLGRSSSLINKTSFKTPLSQLTRKHFSKLLFVAYPSDTDISDSGLLEKTVTLAKISAVLALAGMRRKRAMVLRDMLSIVLARPRLAGTDFFLNSDTFNRRGFATVRHKKSPISQDRPFPDLIESLLATYGVSEIVPEATAFSKNRATSDSNPELDASIKSVVTGILRDALRSSFGNLQLKRTILRQSSDISNLRGNYVDSLAYAAQILHLREVSGTNLPNGDPRWGTNFIGSPAVPPETQTELKTILTERLDQVSLHHLASEATYWDKFLLRAIDVELPTHENALKIFHRKHPTGRQPTKKKISALDQVFVAINTPTRNTTVPTEKLLVAEEWAKLVLTFQNPFNFDSFLECVALVFGTEVPIHETSSVTLPANSFSKAVLTVKPTRSGVMKIHGCRAKISGCFEQLFLNFSSGPLPLQDVKLKALGLDEPSAEKSEIEKTFIPDLSPLRPTVVEVRVLPPQPLLQLIRTSHLPLEPNFLEGQPMTFSMKVINSSPSIPCNFLRVSFESDDISSVEPSDDMQLTWKNPLAEDAEGIAPGSTFSFEIDARGLPRFFEGLFFIDYTYVEDNEDSSSERFYTRQITVPVKARVDPSIQVLDLNALLSDLTGSRAKEFVLLLDLQNQSPNSMWVRLKPKHSLYSSTNKDQLPYSPDTSALIAPGNVARVALSLPRLSRQDGLADLRKSESLLASMVQATWQDIRTNVQGAIDLSRTQPTFQLRDIFLEPELDICVKVFSKDLEIKCENAFHCVPNDLLTLTVTVKNNTLVSSKCLVKVESSRNGFTSRQRSEYASYVVWTGPLDHDLSLDSGSEAKIKLGLCFVSPGPFNIDIVAYPIPIAPRLRDAVENSTQDMDTSASMLQRPLGSAIFRFIVDE